MTLTPPLSLSDVVSVTVSAAPSAVTANTFNQGLFIGNSTAIPSYGANSRLRQYTAATFSTAMLTDGFSSNSPEYIAAQIYFSQNEPAQFIWIGRQDLTAVSAITIGNAAGTGWAVGDNFTITQSGLTNFLGVILVEAGGVPSSIGIVALNQGTGAAVANNLPAVAVSPSTGTGMTVDITAIGETLVQSAQYCRAANTVWYGLAVYNPTDSDNLALSEYADPLWTSTRYYPWSGDVAIANNTTNNLAAQIGALKLRVLGTYSTTQNSLFPNNIYAAVAAMGVDMGLNTGLANSFFSIGHKELVGIAPEPISETQFTNIKALNWNVYGDFGDEYQMYEPGRMSSGDPSYLWLFLAMYVANIQINELNVLQSAPAIAQTNAQQQLLINGTNTASALMASIGFIAGGVWQGATLPVPSASNPAVSNGQALPLGYVNVSPPYSQQSTGNRDAGQAMPIYSLIITAGVVQSLAIAVYTQL